MKESVVAGWYVFTPVYAYLFCRALVCSIELVATGKGFGRTILAWTIVGGGGVSLYVLYEQYLLVQQELLDYVLIGIYGVAIAMMLTTGMLIVVAIVRKGQLFVVQRVLLVACPALAWSLLWLAVLRINIPIVLPFFHRRLVIISSFDIACMLSFVYFLREYIGNVRNVEAKVAEIIAVFGGKRTGQVLTEGISHLPGVLPLMLEVMLFALFRFSIFWGLVRRVVLIPLSFTGTVVAYTEDGKAVVFSVSCMYKISDIARYDNLTQDGASDPRKSLQEQIIGHFSRIAHEYMRKYSWTTIALGNGHGKEIFKRVNQELSGTLGLTLSSPPELHWIGFQDQQLQTLFQELSSRQLRERNNNMKSEEIDRIFVALRRIDSAATRSDAERLWEAFHKGSRGSFYFST